MEHLLFVTFVLIWSLLAIEVSKGPKSKPIKLNKATAKVIVSTFKHLR